jgi:hypothetical protein
MSPLSESYVNQFFKTIIKTFLWLDRVIIPLLTGYSDGVEKSGPLWTACNGTAGF